MNLNPASAAPGQSVVVSGSGTRRTASRLYVEDKLAVSWTMGTKGTYARTVYAPSGADRVVKVVLKQRRSDGVWAQVDSADLTIKSAAPPPPPPPPDSAPTVTAGPTVSDITQTTAKVTWTVSEPATGWIEYGPTLSYGKSTPAETSFDYTTHVQTLGGLPVGQPCYFRVVGKDQAGQPYSKASEFTTAGAVVEPPPPPPPPPSARPFAAPVAPNIVIVPSGANVQAIVNAAPDGTEFRFTGAEHVMTNGIYLRNRHHLIFTGNGSTIRCTGTDGSTATSGFKLDNDNSDIAIRNFTIRGSNPNTTTLYVVGLEYQMGVAIFDGIRIEIDNVNVRNVYGDGVYVAGKQSSPYRSSDQVWVHDSTFDYIGRMGLVHNAALRSTTERCTFDRVGLFVYDIESDYDYEVVDTVAFRDNTIGSYGLSPLYTNWLFACSGGSGAAQVRNIAFERNTVTTGAPINSPNNTQAKGGLASIVERGVRIPNVVFKDNSTTKSGVGPVLRFTRVDGLTVTGNTQPLTSGSLVSASDCTGTTLSPNP